jgi:tetratricopeptide (TPR) repeat protein
MTGMRQGSFNASNQAIANLRHVVDLRPDYADGWGALAYSFSHAAQWRPSQFKTQLEARAKSAAERAQKLDPGNGFARAAMALMLPNAGNQLRIERELRAAVAQHPDNDLLLTSLAKLMLAVGRCREAAQLLDKAMVSAPAVPGTLFTRVQALWAAGRLDEAYRAADDVYALYPADIAVWFTRFYLFAHTGRAREALEQADNREARPRGLPDYNFDVVIAAAQAMLTRRANHVDAAIRANLEASRRGAGYAENAMTFAAGLGRVDTAFAIAEA